MTADEREDLEAEDAARTSVPGEEDLQVPDGADEDERDDERCAAAIAALAELLR